MGTSPTTQRVAANVRAELAAQKITGTALAARIGVTRTTMYRRLAGTAPWPIDEIDAVARVLGVSVEALLAERAA